MAPLLHVEVIFSLLHLLGELVPIFPEIGVRLSRVSEGISKKKMKKNFRSQAKSLLNIRVTFHLRFERFESCFAVTM